jgi:hypothetical protein
MARPGPFVEISSVGSYGSERLGKARIGHSLGHRPEPLLDELQGRRQSATQLIPEGVAGSGYLGSGETERRPAGHQSAACGTVTGRELAVADPTAFLAVTVHVSFAP